MNISFYQYELNAPNPLTTKTGSTRKGALLKVIFSEGNTGYADCHPWPTLGDLDLEEQLKLLAKHQLTPLTERSLRFARLDADARENDISLFDALTLPSSHWLIANLHHWDAALLIQAAEQGFDRFKIKLGHDLRSEIQEIERILDLLPPHTQLRLDFNTALTFNQFDEFLADTASLRTRIDYYEDPFAFESALWAKMQEKYGVRLACDRECFKALDLPSSASVCVVKPAVQSLDPFLKENGQSLVITTYLDHPLGVASAAFSAGEALKKTSAKKVLTCGLLSFNAYLPDAFSRRLTFHGSILVPPEGKGLGFDDLLLALPWTPLVSKKSL